MEKSKFQFSNPRIVSLSYSLNEQELTADKKFSIKPEYSIRYAKVENKNEAVVELQFKIINNGVPSPFNVDAVIKGNFSWAGISEKEVDKFLNVNAPSLLLSYLRPTIAYITNSSGLPQFNIPFLNFSLQD